MNNRFLFRGKREDYGAWVYGNLIHRKIWLSGLYIIRVEDNGFDSYKEYEVIPETVGQCTGLRDKNGNLIFEGDIIRTKKYGRVIEHSTVSDYDIFRITYVPAVFRLESIHRAFNLVGNSADYEVIGNIHDDPELLEVSR